MEVQVFLKLKSMKVNFQNKKALVRVDFNVPLDGEYRITDDTRIRAAVSTIRHILDSGGSAIIMSHMGRPLKKLKTNGTVDREKFTLKHLIRHLTDLLNTPVHFASDCVGENATSKAAALNPGEVLLLENTRFYPEEETGDAVFAQKLAALADVYVNDAFGTAHRAHASTTVVANYFEADQKCFGLPHGSAKLKMQPGVMKNPESPVTCIVGGAKVSDKIVLLERFLDFADNIIVGGAMAYTFMLIENGDGWKFTRRKRQSRRRKRFFEKCESG